jgi:hypothetical protein
LLKRIETWCAAQTTSKARLVGLLPMDDAQIDNIPKLLESFPFELPTPYDRSRFVIPQGYRALLRRCGGVRIETWSDADQAEIWPVFHVFTPGDCSQAHRGAHNTLCDSWTVKGTTVDDREISTTELVSFASAGFESEASRWCFHIGEGGPPSVFLEDNDYECLTGRFVDTGEWISELDKPVFKSFEDWLSTVVDVITERPLDLDNHDDTVNEIISRAERLR